MMETLVGGGAPAPADAGPSYSPHLKKVLKTYQLSATKSLQGPSTVLAAADNKGPAAARKEADSPPPPPPPPPLANGESASSTASPTATACTATGSSSDVFLAPPPFPIQQLPILTAPDQSRSERTETPLEGEAIACFVVGGEKRLCLPQVLNSVLRDFSLAQINQVCDELQIYCSRCTHEQLETLKVTGILPVSAPSCGLITKTDAERLCSALLHKPGAPARQPSKGALSFKVYHECFGKCKGICTPELYTDSNAHCIECVECHGMFSPQRFVCHAHRSLENRTCHWGFDSSNWRAYLLIARDQAEHEKLAKVLDVFKEQHDIAHPSPAALKRKQARSAPEADARDAAAAAAAGELLLKKARLDTADPYAAPPAADPYAYMWMDWARVSSAFRPWPVKDAACKAAPVNTILRDSPPVLLHPERVVPLSESERFERSFQPNVALAPLPRPPQRAHVVSAVPAAAAAELRTQAKMQIVKTEVDEPSSCRVNAGKSPVPTTSTAAIPHYNPEIELSTDTDDSASDLAAETGQEEVVAVLEVLRGGGVSEEVQNQVTNLIQKLTERCCHLERLNEELQQSRNEQERRIASLERRLQLQPVIKHDSNNFQEKLAPLEPEAPCLPSEQQSVGLVSYRSLAQESQEQILEGQSKESLQNELQVIQPQPEEHHQSLEDQQQQEEELQQDQPQQEPEQSLLCELADVSEEQQKPLQNEQEQEGEDLQQQDLSQHVEQSQQKCVPNRCSVGGSPVSVITSPQPSQVAVSPAASSLSTPAPTIIVLNAEPVVVE